MTNSPHAEATLPSDQRLTSIRRADYLGSHPSAPTPLDGVDIVFTTSGVDDLTADELRSGLSDLDPYRN